MGRVGHNLGSLPLRKDGNNTTEWSSQIQSAAELSTRQTRNQTYNRSDATWSKKNFDKFSLKGT